MGATKPHFALLDACRGILALWVLAGHCAHYTGVPEILPAPLFAVDLFMILSGLLMVVMYRSRQNIESFTNPVHWLSFYLRRFFRIAPVYYLLFFISVAATGPLGEMERETSALENGEPVFSVENKVKEAWEGTWDSGMTPYTEVDAINILSHLTFIYGFIPALSSNNWTPDWSIGLEMQFYLVFPFLILFVRKLGYGLLILMVTPVFIQANDWFGLYGTPGSLLHFAQPTFIPLKINVFLIGMLLGEAIAGSNKVIIPVPWSFATSPPGSQVMPWLMGAFVLMTIKQWDWVRYGTMFLGGWIAASTLTGFQVVRLCYDGINRVSRLRIFQLLANTSYFTYLAHLMVIAVVRRWFASNPDYLELPELQKFLLLSSVVALICLSIGCFVYRYIEKPGILLGKYVIDKVMERRKAIPDLDVKLPG